PLCYRMLHLDSCIHFHEPEASVLFQKKLDCSGIGIIRRLRRLYRCLSHFLTKLGSKGNRGGLLYHFLMISLDGAVSFSQMNHIAVLIRQNLKFNMARMLYKMFNVHGIVAESHLCLFLSSLETVFKLLRRSG